MKAKLKKIEKFLVNKENYKERNSLPMKGWTNFINTPSDLKLKLYQQQSFVKTNAFYQDDQNVHILAFDRTQTLCS